MLPVPWDRMGQHRRFEYHPLASLGLKEDLPRFVATAGSYGGGGLNKPLPQTGHANDGCPGGELGRV